MNRPILLFLFLLLSMTSFFACEENGNEDPSNEPNIDVGFWYDGANFTAPNLPQGIYETAARYPSSVMSTFNGQRLAAIHVFFLQRPFLASLKIYEAGTTADAPGALLYSQAIDRFDLEENDWSRIALTTPPTLDGEEIWISFQFEHGASTSSLGCDSGPRNPDGDRFFVAGSWTDFATFANGESINWNIRAEVE